MSLQSAAMEEASRRPLYARALRLRYVNPGGMLCFLFFEGAVALGVLLALAELVSWWGVLVMPALVAAMVKVNDVIVGAVGRSAQRVPLRVKADFQRQVIQRRRAVGRAAVRDAASVPATDNSPATPADTPADHAPVDHAPVDHAQADHAPAISGSSLNTQPGQQGERGEGRQRSD